MATVTNFRRDGDSALERVGALPDKTTGKISADAIDVPAHVKPYVASFKSVHVPYAKACDEADATREVRDGVLEDIGKTAEALDPLLEALASKLADAKLGTRMRPFAAFSSYAPSDLGKLAYAMRKSEVIKLADAVLAATSDAAAVKAAHAVKAGADLLGTRLDSLAMPQAKFAGAMAARDALLPDWHAQWREFKKQLRAAWSQEPGKLAFVLAPPPVIAVEKKGKRVKKVAATV